MSKGSGEKKLLLLPWLIVKLDGGQTPGLTWCDREKGVFSIKWTRMDNNGDPEQNSAVFKEWAIYKKRFTDVEKPEWKVWKQRLRCSLNKLITNNQLRKMTDSDTDLLRVFQIVDQTGVQSSPLSEESNSSVYDLSLQSPNAWQPVASQPSVPDFSYLVSDEEFTDNEIGTDQKGNLDEAFKQVDSTNLILQNCDGTICPENYSIGSGNFSLPVSMETGSVKDANINQPCAIDPGLFPDFLDVIGNFAMTLALRWGDRVIQTMDVSNSKGCRVFYADSFSCPEWDEKAFGAREAEQINILYRPNPQDRGCEKQLQLLQALEMGISFWEQNGCIYLMRRCKARGFVTVDGKHSGKLERMQTVKVFDLLGGFYPALQRYDQNQGPRPSPYVIVAFGRDFCGDAIDPYAGLHFSITVSLTPAIQLLNFPTPTSPSIDLSHSNEYDQFLEAFRKHASIASSSQQSTALI